MPIRRSYADRGDGCAAAHAFDVVGDRWAVIVIRELTLGPKRFSDLLADSHGATPTVLTSRLRELQQAGVIEQVELPPPARIPAYRLTPWGREFEPILEALGRWAQRSPSRPRAGALTPDASILAMSTMTGGPMPRRRLVFDLGLHDDRHLDPAQTWYHISCGPDVLVADKHSQQSVAPDAIACSSTVWTRLLFDDQDHESILALEDVSSRGAGLRVVKKFLSHFRRTMYQA
jgi:DNA-binding HxlR family transcriptional regulator